MKSKKTKVIMLPTEDESYLAIAWGDSLVCGIPKMFKKSRDYQPQHLYYITDEKIKNGDWCIMLDDAGEVFSSIPQQYLKEQGHTLNKNLFKIIATSDCKLTIEIPIHTKSKSEKELNTILKLKLPQIPQSFVEEYYRLKNKQI